MMKLTIKLKITLWFTAFMILLCAVLFAFIAFVSNSTVSHETRGALTSLIDRNTHEIEYDDGRLKVDDDYIPFRNGIYSLIFDEYGGKISGYAPYGELEQEPFADKEIRSVKIDGETYLIYDRLLTFRKHDDIWVRGVVPERGNAITSSAMYRAVLIALPLLIVLAAVGGYLLAKRSLRPIQDISKTAEEIGGSGDLSKRIEMEPGGDELHQLAGVFNQMFDRLETNFEAERNFTSDASHELRTPVATILAQCEYAFENASGEEELYDAIGTIQKQGYRMSRLIESLLSFTRLEQQTEKHSFETVDMSALALSVCREQSESGEKNISLSADVEPGIEMKADRTLLARMLENLIHNAFRYGRENGSIGVGLKREGGQIHLSVKDDGIGIAPEDITKIWNRFYRADKSRSSSGGQGFGLGLPIVRQIAELHGGSVHADSDPGHGSVFTIKFAEK